MAAPLQHKLILIPELLKGSRFLVRAHTLPNSALQNRIRDIGLGPGFSRVTIVTNPFLSNRVNDACRRTASRLLAWVCIHRSSVATF